MLRVTRTFPISISRIHTVPIFHSPPSVPPNRAFHAARPRLLQHGGLRRRDPPEIHVVVGGHSHPVHPTHPLFNTIETAFNHPNSSPGGASTSTGSNRGIEGIGASLREEMRVSIRDDIKLEFDGVVGKLKKDFIKLERESAVTRDRLQQSERESAVTRDRLQQSERESAITRRDLQQLARITLPPMRALGTKVLFHAVEQAFIFRRQFVDRFLALHPSSTISDVPREEIDLEAFLRWQLRTARVYRPPAPRTFFAEVSPPLLVFAGVNPLNAEEQTEVFAFIRDSEPRVAKERIEAAHRVTVEDLVFLIKACPDVAEVRLLGMCLESVLLMPLSDPATLEKFGHFVLRNPHFTAEELSGVQVPNCATPI